MGFTGNKYVPSNLLMWVSVFRKKLWLFSYFFRGIGCGLWTSFCGWDNRLFIKEWISVRPKDTIWPNLLTTDGTIDWVPNEEAIPGFKPQVAIFALKNSIAILVIQFKSFVANLAWWAEGDWIVFRNICPPNYITVFTCKLTIRSFFFLTACNFLL